MLLVRHGVWTVQVGRERLLHGVVRQHVRGHVGVVPESWVLVRLAPRPREELRLHPLRVQAVRLEDDLIARLQGKQGREK